MILNLSNPLINRDALGIGIAFPFTRDKTTNDLLVLRYEDNIKSCILWLLSTRIGERLMNEDCGTTIMSALFGNIDGLADALPIQIKEAIARFEPRVVNVTTKTERIGINDLRITIGWTVKATGNRDSYVYPYSAQPAQGAL